MSDSAESLLADIEAFLQKANIAESTFGARIAGDSTFVSRLREGRVTSRVMEKVRIWLSANPDIPNRTKSQKTKASAIAAKIRVSNDSDLGEVKLSIKKAVKNLVGKCVSEKSKFQYLTLALAIYESHDGIICIDSLKVNGRNFLLKASDLINRDFDVEISNEQCAQ